MSGGAIEHLTDGWWRRDGIAMVISFPRLVTVDTVTSEWTAHDTR